MLGVVLLKSAVEEIVRGIEKGVYFDSHFIIDTVIRDFSDVYLTYAVEKQASGKVTEYVHSEIAKLVSSFDGTLVGRVPDAESISYNVRGRASKCALWIRS